MKWLLAPLLLALLAAPSGAIDLTGTWSGSFKCTEYDGDADDGEPEKFKQTFQTLRITQTGNDLAVEWVDEGGFLIANVRGVAISDVKKPDAKARAVLADCETGADLVALYSELTELQATVDRDKGKGTLKGAGVYSPGDLAMGACKWKFKLESTADPAVPAGCPAP